MRLKVTVVVEVDAPGEKDAEALGRRVETITLRALEQAGLEPISAGYGYQAVR